MGSLQGYQSKLLQVRALRIRRPRTTRDHKLATQTEIIRNIFHCRRLIHLEDDRNSILIETISNLATNAPFTVRCRVVRGNLKNPGFY